MSLLLGTLVHGLEAIQKTRITVFLRETPGRDRPRAAAFWRSEATMSSISANLRGLERLFTQSRMETALPGTASYLGETIRFEFRQSIETADSLQGPIAALLGDPDQRTRLEYLSYTFDILIGRLNDEFAPAAGLVAGISFESGD